METNENEPQSETVTEGSASKEVAKVEKTPLAVGEQGYIVPTTVEEAFRMAKAIIIGGFDKAKNISPQWTQDDDAHLQAWISQYVDWLFASDLGEQVRRQQLREQRRQAPIQRLEVARVPVDVVPVPVELVEIY